MMGVEEKIEQVEGELKLVKNEIKEALTGVHDFLLNLKVPQNSVPLETKETTVVNLGGGLEIANKPSLPPILPDLGNGSKSSEEPAEAPMPLPDRAKSSHVPPAVTATPEPALNALANLINWVSLAKQRLGAESLPTVLEIYGMCGNLSPRTRKIILRLAELETGPARAEGEPDVWSQLMLQLHGILTGDVSPDADHSKVSEGEGRNATGEGNKISDSVNSDVGDGERPARLKLVLPDENGRGKELDLGEFKMQALQRK